MVQDGTPERLVSDRLLQSSNFVRDFTLLASLSSGALYLISEEGNFAEPRALCKRFDFSLEQAINIIRMAAFLYERAAEMNLSASDAVAQITTAAEELMPPVVIDPERAEAFGEILSFKRAYEVSNTGKMIVGPRLSQLEGAWAVGLFNLRDGEPIRVPVLSLRFEWYDGAGNLHEALVQVDDTVWSEFTQRVVDIDSARSDLNSLLQE